MSLVADYGPSSDSSSDSNSDSSEEKHSFQNQQQAEEPKTNKLPPPSFIGDSFSSVAPNASVFVNPFLEAENAKQAILEKHVKMVNKKDNLKVINGKKICWNYRKGRCRFGHNCVYAHDSDLQKTQEQLDSEARPQETVLYQNQKVPEPTPEVLEQIREESVTGNKQKKRPGLTQGLVPGKRVMKSYHKQQMKSSSLM